MFLMNAARIKFVRRFFVRTIDIVHFCVMIKLWIS